MRADDIQVERQIADPLAVEGSVEYHYTSTRCSERLVYKPCTVSILSPVPAKAAARVPKAFPTYRRTGSIAWWL
jgi:hypothetical protein